MFVLFIFIFNLWFSFFFNPVCLPARVYKCLRRASTWNYVARMHHCEYFYCRGSLQLYFTIIRLVIDQCVEHQSLGVTSVRLFSTRLMEYKRPPYAADLHSCYNNVLLERLECHGACAVPIQIPISTLPKNAKR